MMRLNKLTRIGLILYFFFYLIFPNLAISQNFKKDILINIQNGLNNRDYNSISEYFEGNEIINLKDKFSKIIKEFPNAKWLIKISDKNQKNNNNIFHIKFSGSKVLNNKEYILNSNFDYNFVLINGKITKGVIKNLLTTVRNDKNKIDLDISIPDKVLTGSNYDIDIIVNNPLDNSILAGGIKEYQEDSLLNEPIILEPLSSGGLYKMTRAPSKPGIQIWSGMIAHPEGLISFTKTVDIIDEF